MLLQPTPVYNETNCRHLFPIGICYTPVPIYDDDPTLVCFIRFQKREIPSIHCVHVSGVIYM